MLKVAVIAGWIDWRQPGGVISAAGHAAVLIVGLAAFSSARTFDSASEAVPVDMISESQFNEMMKGDSQSKVKAPEPVRRVDRVAEAKQDNPPGEAKREVAAEPPKAPAVQPAQVQPPPPPPPRPEPAKAEPPPPLPPPAPPRVAVVTPPAPPLRVPELRRAPPPPPEKSEEEDEEEAEVVRQKPPPKVEPPKPQPAAAPPQAKPAPKPEELAKLLEEEQKREEATKVEAKRKAEAEKAAQEKAAREKAAREKAERERKERAAKQAAEEKKLTDAIAAKLAASKEPPATTGATGPRPQQQASLGTAHATGQKLSPSDRAQLIGLLTEQMSRCISYSGSAPKAYPRLTFTLGRDGAVVSAVNLGSSSPEPNFRPFAEAAMRAVRNCQPYRIPARFLETYEDWKNVQLTLITDDLQ